MVAGMVCVQCGSSAVPGRFACAECGSALVSVPEDGPNGPRPLPVAPDADEVRKRLRRRHVRAMVIAVLAVGFVVVLAAGGGIWAWSEYANEKPPVPGDLSAYASGDGRTYATADFSVRLPEGYRITPQQLDVAGGLELTMATATVGNTILEVATGTLPSASRAGSSKVAALAQQVTSLLGEAGPTASVKKVSTPEGDAYDIRFSLPSGAGVSSRVIVYGRRLILLSVAAPHHAQGGLDALIASYHPV